MMHAKLEKEFNRIFDTLTATDPASHAYGIVLSSFEMLDSIGPSINDFLYSADSTPNGDCNEDCADCPNCEDAKQTAEDNITEFPTPVPEAHPTEPEAEPAPAAPAPTLTAPEVRAKLAEARRNGINVAAIIKEFGVENFTALPATKYADLLDRISNAGME